MHRGRAGRCDGWRCGRGQGQRAQMSGVPPLEAAAFHAHVRRPTRTLPARGPICRVSDADAALARVAAVRVATWAGVFPWT